IGGIAYTVRAVAKHYVQVPPEIVHELSRISARLNRRRAGMTEKNRQRLAQLDSPRIEQKLLSHALIEMRKLAQKQKPTWRDAVGYWVLLAIEILIVAPMRLDNVVNLDLDRHFTWPPNELGDIGIVIPRTTVKNRQPLSYKVPGESAVAFDAFIRRFRPL